MSSGLEKFCNFCRSFGNIEWRTTSIIICALPFALLILFMQILIILFDYNVGSIVSNAEKCADVGHKIMDEGGSVIDVAIAVLLCESVFLPHRVGIGGGFTAIMYIDGKFDTITATPTVPANFPNGLLKIDRKENSLLAAVPGELKGYWEMHKKYGMLPWAHLFQPTIEICEKGFSKSEWKENYPNKLKYDIYRSPLIRRLFYSLVNENDSDIIKFSKLSKTLRKVADGGINVFYEGEIGQALIGDLRKVGGIMNEQDLRDYNVSWNSEPVTFRLPHNLKGYTTPLPSSGALVALIMNIIKSLPNKDTPLFWHKVIEAMKHAYGRSFNLADVDHETNAKLHKIIKSTYADMIDMNFAVQVRDLINDRNILKNISDYGVKFRSTYQGSSSNICVISTRGNAIVLSSSLFTKSSSAFYSTSTGIFVNNQILSFEPINYGNWPYSPNSFIRSGKRIFTGHCPTIIIKCFTAEIFFVVGASGDEGAVSQVITAIIQHSLLRQNVFKAVNSRFFFPNVMDSKVLMSSQSLNRSDIILNYLIKVGHNLLPFGQSNPYAFRTCISHSSIFPTPKSTENVASNVVIVQPKNELNIFLVFIIVSLSISTIAIMAYEIIKFPRNNINLMFSSATET